MSLLVFSVPHTESADQWPLPPPEGSLFTAAGQAGAAAAAAASLRQGHPDELEAACTGTHCEYPPPPSAPHLLFELVRVCADSLHVT